MIWMRPITPPACSGCATMSIRIASKGSLSVSPAASISALCAAMATDALGHDRVRCLMLPFRYTSQQSLDDAAAIARALGVRYDIVPIESAVHGLEAALNGVFAGSPRDVTEENLQARARGTILMAVSNKFSLMVVTTGNKSEMSVGYATLYGDMNGGFNPIKDLYKTEVFRLARLRNRWKPADAKGPAGEVIVQNVLTRAPSAELRENQTDQDTLPPYDVLDQILERLVEREESTAEHHCCGVRPRDRDQGRAHAHPCRIQAPAGGARRESDTEEFRSRPALSDRQSVSRSGYAGAAARPDDQQNCSHGQSRRIGFLKNPLKRSASATATRSATTIATTKMAGRRCGRCACWRHHWLCSDVAAVGGWIGACAGLRRSARGRRLALRFRLRQRLGILVGHDDVAVCQRA